MRKRQWFACIRDRVFLRLGCLAWHGQRQRTLLHGRQARRDFDCPRSPSAESSTHSSHHRDNRHGPQQHAAKKWRYVSGWRTYESTRSLPRGYLTQKVDGVMPHVVAAGTGSTVRSLNRSDSHKYSYARKGQSEWNNPAAGTTPGSGGN